MHTVNNDEQIHFLFRISEPLKSMRMSEREWLFVSKENIVGINIPKGKY